MAMESIVFHGIVGRSRQMRRVIRSIREVAPLDIPVLIYGESGAGKELVARAIHQESARKRGPFHAVNAGAIPSALVASELFGHEKGAFTGATSARQGFFETARGGTLFLDEIATMKHDMQVSLLRVLETSRFTRVGGTSESAADVRIIAATNSYLPERKNGGNGRSPAEDGANDGAELSSTFRRDLYYRLSVFTINLPPLRQRRADIPLLVYHFLSHVSEDLGREVTGFEDAAVRQLCAYGWPGNVRELLNVVTRLVVSARERIISEGEVVEALYNLPPEFSGSGSESHAQGTDSISQEPGVVSGSDSVENHREDVEEDGSGGGSDATDHNPGSGADTSVLRAGETIEDAERELIRLTLAHASGNRTRAAKLLGISRKSLYNKMKIYGIGD